MNNAWKLVIAAAAVVVVALVGINLMPSSGLILGPGPSPTANPTQTPSPTQAPSPSTGSNLNLIGDYVAGTTYVLVDSCCVAPGRMTFTIPATGWYSAFDSWRIFKNVAGGSDTVGMYVTPQLVENVHTGGCHWKGTALVPPVGPTVDDLAIALNAQAGPGASPPVSVTVGGHSGKKVELSIPEDVDTDTCDSDGYETSFGRIVTDGGYGAAPYLHGNGQHNTYYIVDVEGTRQVIDAMYLPGTSAADRAELDQIVASITFETAAPSPSPSP